MQHFHDLKRYNSVPCKAMTLFSIGVILCLFVSKSLAIDSKDVSKDDKLVDIVFVNGDVSATALKDQERHDVALEEAACDCGPNSAGCRIESGIKICDCEYPFRQDKGTCKAWCDDLRVCSNGGVCVNKTCQCRPGASGDFCQTVEACEGSKGSLLCGDPDEVTCKLDLDSGEPYCECRFLHHLFYPKERSCVECDCGYGNCTLVEGKKTCSCKKGSALRTVGFWGEVMNRCDACNCGNNSDGCSFDGYTKVCNCRKGFAQEPDILGDICTECSCGPHGQCYFNGSSQYCNCDEGYKPFRSKDGGNLTCEACDCGENGECFFEGEEKKCNCSENYAVRNEVCTACECYADNLSVPCIYFTRGKRCFCPDGFDETRDNCTDRDECFDWKACPPFTDCVNTIGSYECICWNGFEPVSPTSDVKVDGCKDIDECKDVNACPEEHTSCANFPGAYQCYCDDGYRPVPPMVIPNGFRCEKEGERKKGPPKLKTAAIIGIVIGVIICIGAIGILGVFIYKRRFTRRPPSGVQQQ